MFGYPVDVCLCWHIKSKDESGYNPGLWNNLEPVPTMYNQMNLKP